MEKRKGLLEVLLPAVLMAIALLLLQTGQAVAEEGKWVAGAQAGEVGLAQDVGNTYGNALGVGAFFDYAPSDFFDIEVTWLESHHQMNALNLYQNAFAAEAIYNVDQFDVFTPYIEGGAEFVSHSQDVPVGATVSTLSNTGFGLNIGAGAKIDLGKNFQTGLDFCYHSIFPVSITPAGTSQPVNVIESYFTVLVRLGFSFGGGGSWLNR